MICSLCSALERDTVHAGDLHSVFILVLIEFLVVNLQPLNDIINRKYLLRHANYDLNDIQFAKLYNFPCCFRLIGINFHLQIQYFMFKKSKFNGMIMNKEVRGWISCTSIPPPNVYEKRKENSRSLMVLMEQLIEIITHTH